MHKGAHEVEAFLDALRPTFSSLHINCGLAVPFTSIQKATEMAVEGLAGLHIGAQNMNDANEGAFTGEIAAKMLKSVGAQFVLLGHSERRRYFHEDDALIHRKVNRAIKESLPFVLCIGETLDEREAGHTLEVLKRQIASAIESVNEVSLPLLTIAYEPVWAIGTGVTATVEQVEQTLKEVRALLEERFSEGGKTIPLLYGGSVTTKNCKELTAVPYVDGFLVGGGSLEPQHFIEICSAKA